jgi:hypothetical protein
VKEQLFYQPAATLEVGRSDRRSRDTDTPTPSCTGQHPVISSAGWNLSVSLLETRDQLNLPLPQSALTGEYGEIEDEVEASGHAEKGSDVLTRGVNFKRDGRGLSVRDAACSLSNNDSFSAKRNDNGVEADGLRGGFISKDAAASHEMELNSAKETLLTSSLSPHSTQEPMDPRSLRKADLACLIEQNENIDGAQKERLIEVLVKHLKSTTARPGKCNLFKYKFQVETDRPIVGYSRPSHFQ